MPQQDLRQDQHDAIVTRDIVMKQRRVRDAADAVLPGDYITKSQFDALQVSIKSLQLQLNKVITKIGGI